MALDRLRARPRGIRDPVLHFAAGFSGHICRRTWRNGGRHGGDRRWGESHRWMDIATLKGFAGNVAETGARPVRCPSCRWQ